MNIRKIQELRLLKLTLALLICPTLALHAADKQSLVLQPSTDRYMLNVNQLTFEGDNGEAYFNFETFDPYYINFEDSLTKEQLTELEETKNN